MQCVPTWYPSQKMEFMTGLPPGLLPGDSPPGLGWDHPRSGRPVGVVAVTVAGRAAAGRRRRGSGPGAAVAVILTCDRNL